MGKYKLILDPRTKIFLLLVSNLLLFFGEVKEVVYIYIAVLIMIFLLSRSYKAILTFAAIFMALLCVNHIILPILPQALAGLFSISINYTFKMLPCLISGTLLIKTTSLHDIVLAMRKYHLPQSLIVTLSVTLRYFPAIFEESRNIHNAMKLRTIHLSEKFECFVVPFMIAVSTTVEELSAAAITRGIENPTKKTSILQLRFYIMDYLFILIGTGFLVAIFMI